MQWENLPAWHRPSNGEWVAVDTSDEGMWVISLAISIIEGLEDDRLASRKSSSGHNNNLALFQAII